MTSGASSQPEPEPQPRPQPHSQQAATPGSTPGSTPGPIPRPPPAFELRRVTDADLPTLFAFHSDPEAVRMAAFPARERDAFMAHWHDRILGDDRIVKQGIVVDDELAGYLICFEQSDLRLIGYWLGRAHWGRGIATAALRRFVGEIRTRPLNAYVSKQNAGSIRVLEKCGFVRTGEHELPALSGDGVVLEHIYTLHEIGA